MSEREVSFGGYCVFCGQEIDILPPDPIRLVVTTSTELWQVWWCHAACFKDRIVSPPDAPGMLDPAHF